MELYYSRTRADLLLELYELFLSGTFVSADSLSTSFT